MEAVLAFPDTSERSSFLSDDAMAKLQLVFCADKES